MLNKSEYHQSIELKNNFLCYRASTTLLDQITRKAHSYDSQTDGDTTHDERYTNLFKCSSIIVAVMH